MTAPYLEDSAEYLAQAHGQKITARATHPDFTGAIDLDVESGSLIWDESSAPRVSATLVCKVPEDQSTLDLLDPRTGVRVEIDAGYIRPGGLEDVHTIADLGLRDRQVSRPENLMTLTLASDEALVIDGSPALSQSVTGNYAPTAISNLIKTVIVPYPKITNNVDVPVSPVAISINPVTDRWATIEDLADQMEIDVYDAGLRDWIIEPRPVIAGASSLSLQVGANGTIIESETGLSRDPWYNYVALRYEWRDTSDVEHFIKASAFVSAGDYAITGNSSKKIYMEEREVPTSQTQANASCVALLKRFLSKGRSMTLSAISAYWIRPGMTITIQLPVGPQERHLVSRVEFDLETGRMSIDTRLPDSATISIATTTPPPPVPEDPPPPPEPDPEPPAKTTYVSTWVANTSESYKGNGDPRTDTSDLVQGYQSANGNGRGIMLFTAANSTGGETNKSITTALSGATITKIEVYMYAYHWYSAAGGYARLGYYGGTSIPGTYTGGSPYIVTSKWGRNSGRWINITSAGFKSALLAGTARGVTIGPGVGTSQAYYGRFYGHSGTYPPKLRITYSK